MSFGEKYGLPREYEVYALPIKEFVEKNPGIEKFLSEKEGISELVKGYDAIMPINITLDYIRKRKFDTMKAFRELIQNALDETELVEGKPDAEIFVDKLGTWIKDKGRGLEAKAFVIGTSEKDCWMRGYYGEGLKISLGYFLTQGHQPYVFSNGKVFKPVLYPDNSDNPMIYILMGESKIESKGTNILISGFEVSEEELKKIISFKCPELEDKVIDVVSIRGTDCDVEKPYVIYDYPNRLYIRNLYVGKMEEVAKRPSFFSYDIWWFRLDVSRELLTYTMPQLFIEVSKIFEQSDKAKAKLAEKLIESEMVRIKEDYGGKIIEFSPIFGIFEGHLFVYAFPRGLLEHIVEKLQLGEKTKCIRLFTEKNTKDDIIEAIENGIIPFMISSEIAEKTNIPVYQKGEKC